MRTQRNNLNIQNRTTKEVEEDQENVNLHL